MTVRWQAKLTNSPSNSPPGARAASTPTSGSIGPAGLTISGFPLPGWVACRPSRIRNRRLKLMLGSWPNAVAQLGGVERVIRRDHRLGDPLGDQLDIFRVGVRLEAGRHRPAAVRVAGADQDVGTGDFRGGGDRLAGLGRGFLADEDGVDPDQGDRGLCRSG